MTQRDLFASLQAACPNVSIGVIGGFNRDAGQGKPGKDLDVCFVCDEEMHDNSPVYADEGLASFVTKKNEEAKAEGIGADGEATKDAEGSETQLQVQKV